MYLPCVRPMLSTLHKWEPHSAVPTTPPSPDFAVSEKDRYPASLPCAPPPCHPRILLNIVSSLDGPSALMIVS
ncbi:hypothetical protein HETIRDRAFT_481806 [Heterobasidion irregulare TC 32-1]|uniref:Uncharacterized protein n=1 Tax=Heterobasidion irregulare (strain TC 32-1) TaxID=747525 RepID=W4JNJ6_HETIT|nr:uncharacterized protein HETIRDRAFT_481806 [Heterobasidion irregulare TC 32-1]ETW75132.1 hypothetical protein HETIRDRAFT_481806 [Heterobasidion irregulare TC 32-1]